ncbi:DJ-1/PfpI family protein [Phenylobacterium montanum]|uniref:DJ-1/PfpI family protein n=1 Tax=Phenylobacterium montanum TaxID=2823693 RepID=A0A975IVR6_9CAUL|nr:DJ-1/PfpI family protein [Caulobacter sp. S6]QUD87616.1 DJ-1/PfpI family protein [Caulobacter sp. S6]
MDRRGFIMAGVGGAVAIAVAGPAAGTAAISPDEHARTIALMRPPKRARPLVAIVADNVGAETTDLMIPFNVLSRSGLADVAVLAPEAAPIQLMPALRIQPTATLAAFDAAHPDGPDYVIVPAQHRRDTPALLPWLRKQAAGGATVIGVCAGGATVAAAGLIDHRRFTSHWAEIEGLRKAHPSATWQRDRRYVADRGVVTTTGVTASLPMSLALVEAIAGPERAQSLAASLGAPGTDERHDSAAFRLTKGDVGLALGNIGAFWGHETVGLPVAPGQDELALAFTADAWSRTYRSRCVTVGKSGTVRLAYGLELIVDRTGDGGRLDLMLPPLSDERPAASLDTALAAIARRYGRPTAGFVALQVEYPWSGRA